MGNLFEWSNVGIIDVTDIEGLKNWIKGMKDNSQSCNGEDWSNLLHLNHYANPEENKLGWTVEIGHKSTRFLPYDEKYDDEPEEEIYIDKVMRLWPEDCTEQIFLSKLSKYTEQFDFIVTRTSLPSFDEYKSMWRIYVKSPGEIGIQRLVIKIDEEIDDISQSE